MIFQEYPSVCRPVDFSEEEMGGDGNEVSLSVIYKSWKEGIFVEKNFYWDM